MKSTGLGNERGEAGRKQQEPLPEAPLEQQWDDGEGVGQ